MTIVGKNEIYNRKIWLGHFWYTNFWVPNPPPSLPPPAALKKPCRRVCTRQTLPLCLFMDWEKGLHCCTLACPQVLGGMGNTCPTGYVCEERSCFRENLLNYDNILNAMVMNLGLVSMSDVWFTAAEYNAAAGPNVWWYFVAASAFGTYVTILSRIILLYNYMVIDALPFFKPKKKNEVWKTVEVAVKAKCPGRQEGSEQDR